MKQQYNLYYGTVDGPLKIQYRGTRSFVNDEFANAEAFKEASNLYYKNEGKFGLPGFNKIKEEQEITGINILKLYEEHIKDLMRWFAIPTEVDIVNNKGIKFI